MALLQDTWTKGVLLHIPIGLTSDSNCMTGHPYKKYRQSTPTRNTDSPPGNWSVGCDS